MEVYHAMRGNKCGMLHCVFKNQAKIDRQYECHIDDYSWVMAENAKPQKFKEVGVPGAEMHHQLYDNIFDHD